MTATAKALLVAALLAAGFGSGWLVNGWRLAEGMIELRLEHSEAVGASYLRGIKVQAERQAEKDRQNSDLALIDKTELDKLRSAQNETNRLRDCISRGTCGLRVAAVCPNTGSNLPPAGPTGSVDTGPGAVLSPVAESAYFALRENLTLTERTLAACQASAARLTGQTAPTVPATP